MKTGTKSIIYGAHSFLIHPWLVAAAWWRLYGFPSDIRLWVAFVVHDWGYWGKPDMDGEEGETHVELGAKIMEKLFGKQWADFCRYHSRFYAQKDGVQPSRLCYADKLAICYEWEWFYLLRSTASGEITEYMNLARKKNSKYSRDAYMNLALGNNSEWFHSVKRFTLRYVSANYNINRHWHKTTSK